MNKKVTIALFHESPPGLTHDESHVNDTYNTVKSGLDVPFRGNSIIKG